MPPVPFADSFLAGSLLTILLPLGLLIVVVIWYVIAVKRVPGDTPESSPSLPPAEVVHAAGPAVVADVTPADSPADRAAGPPADPPADES
jgi:hypothetical protein